MSRKKLKDIKKQVKRYKGVKLTKYSDGSVFMESNKKIKNFTKYHKGQPYVNSKIVTGGFTRAKKYLDKRLN